MSDLSDKLGEALQKRTSQAIEELGDGDPGAVAVNVHEVPDLATQEGFTAMIHYYNEESLRKIRLAYRERAGAKAFPDAGEAVDYAVNRLMQDMVPLPLCALADGIQLAGDQPSFAVKKYRLMDKMDDIYNSKAFIKDSELIAMTYLDDHDSKELVESLLRDSVYHIGILCGYPSMTGKDLDRIWDLMALAVRSATTSMWLAGKEMGKEITETDTLAGIMAATEAQSDG